MQIMGGLSTFSKISNPLKVYVLEVLMYSVGLPTFGVRCTPWVPRRHKCQSAVELTCGIIPGWVFQRPKPRVPRRSMCCVPISHMPKVLEYSPLVTPQKAQVSKVLM
jgi:hypothetical protein